MNIWAWLLSEMIQKFKNGDITHKLNELNCSAILLLAELSLSYCCTVWGGYGIWCLQVLTTFFVFFMGIWTLDPILLACVNMSLSPLNYIPFTAKRLGIKKRAEFDFELNYNSHDWPSRLMDETGAAAVYKGWCVVTSKEARGKVASNHRLAIHIQMISYKRYLACTLVQRRLSIYP